MHRDGAAGPRDTAYLADILGGLRMVEGQQVRILQPEATSLLLTGTLASPNHKISVCCSPLCAMGKDTIPALPPEDSGIGKSLG